MKTKIFTIGFFLVFALLLNSCSILHKTTPIPPIDISTSTPFVIIVTATPQATEQPSAINPTETPSPAPSKMAIVHSITPSEPTFTTAQTIPDCNTGERQLLNAPSLVAEDCDNWRKSRLERPSDIQNGFYFPSLDIISASMASSPEFLYGKIVLYKDAMGAIPVELASGFELDTDIDSRGEILVIATNITSTTWTTEGVQVWQDTNGDVGGDKPDSPDSKKGDGYETLLFDSGVGNDPDLAWQRISPDDAASIEIAFKPSLLAANGVFAWWAWTSLGGLKPANMEVVDMLDDSTAWKMDNTCSWIFNGKPSDMLANICAFEYPTPVPTLTATLEPGVPTIPFHICVYPTVWHCYPAPLGCGCY
jgi:hypothetical protein